MVKYCCAYNCKEIFKKGGSITFHSFPKDELRRKLWLIKIRRADFTSSEYSKICSKHFTPDSFDTEKFGGTWLKKNAIPTIFDFPPHKSDPNAEKLLSELMERSIKRPKVDAVGKRKHFIGDFTDEDMDCPEEARRVLHLAKSQKEESQEKIHRLWLKNRHLEKKVASLQEKLLIAQKQLNAAYSKQPIQRLKNLKKISVSSNKKTRKFEGNQCTKQQEKPENLKEISVFSNKKTRKCKGNQCIQEQEKAESLKEISNSGNIELS